MKRIFYRHILMLPRLRALRRHHTFFMSFFFNIFLTYITRGNVRRVNINISIRTSHGIFRRNHILRGLSILRYSNSTHLHHRVKTMTNCIFSIGPSLTLHNKSDPNTRIRGNHLANAIQSSGTGGLPLLRFRVSVICHLRATGVFTGPSYLWRHRGSTLLFHFQLCQFKVYNAPPHAAFFKTTTSRRTITTTNGTLQTRPRRASSSRHVCSRAMFQRRTRDLNGSISRRHTRRQANSNARATSSHRKRGIRTFVHGGRQKVRGIMVNYRGNANATFPRDNMRGIRHLMLHHVSASKYYHYTIFTSKSPHAPNTKFRGTTNTRGRGSRGNGSGVMVPTQKLRKRTRGFQAKGYLSTRESTYCQNPIRTSGARSFQGTRNSGTRVGTKRLTSKGKGRRSRRNNRRPNARRNGGRQGVNTHRRSNYHVHTCTRGTNVASDGLATMTISSISQTYRRRVRGGLCTSARRVTIVRRGKRGGYHRRRGQCRFTTIFIRGTTSKLAFFFRFTFLPVLVQDPFKGGVEAVVEGAGTVVSHGLSRGDTVP